MDVADINAARANSQQVSLAHTLRPKKRDEADVEKAAKSFEGVFINEMMGHAFQQVKLPKPFGGGFAEEMYHSLLVNEYAKVLTAQGGVGVSAPVKQELLRLQEAQNGQ
jgi:flagellar protein FlgJ